MKHDSWAPYGAGAGAVAVALFVVGSVIIGERPGFDAPAAEVAADFDEHRTRIQVGCAVLAALAPFLVWFLATIASLTRSDPPGARRAAAVAYGCGLIFVTLFLADVTALAVGALRPENMLAAPSSPRPCATSSSWPWARRRSRRRGCSRPSRCWRFATGRSGRGGSVGSPRSPRSSTRCGSAPCSRPRARSRPTACSASGCR